MTCKSIVMRYKDNCKAEGPVITRLKIARHYFADGIAQKESPRILAAIKIPLMKLLDFVKISLTLKSFGCCPANEKIKTSDLKLFEFLKFESRAPKTNKRMADENTEKTISRETFEIKLRL